MLEELKYRVWEANRRLAKLGLAKFSEGSVSGADRDKGLFVIKPEGVDFDELLPESFSVIDFNANVLEGDTPSADWLTHLALYKSFADIGAVAHFAGDSSLGFAAARRPVPVFSTLHAKHFKGDIPATRLLTKEEIAQDFELNIGKTVAEAFENRSYTEIPAVIVSGDMPYAWAKTPQDAVMNAAYAETAAKTALSALTLSQGLPPLSVPMIEKVWTKNTR
ncbi:MAG: class II aldolase/adducin family protein [Clostridia bacterium]|nr:class II aldolase/adducin family protein [Clostridia bacterium]